MVLAIAVAPKKNRSRIGRPRATAARGAEASNLEPPEYGSEDVRARYASELGVGRPSASDESERDLVRE